MPKGAKFLSNKLYCEHYFVQERHKMKVQEFPFTRIVQSQAYDDNLTKVYKWKDVAAVSKFVDKEDRCSICLEIFVVPRILTCSHIFCSVCILLLKENGKVFFIKGFYYCPICNVAIDENPKLVIMNFSNSGFSFPPCFSVDSFILFKLLCRYDVILI